MLYLKQSTLVTLRIGPFLDATDGVTEEVALGSMGVEISKAHGAFAARNSATATAHDAEGWYSCELNATDTNTLGALILKAHAAATHLPVWHPFTVLAANIFDSIVGGGDTLDVQVTGMGAGVVTAAAVATGAIDADALATDAVNEIVDQVWNEAQADHVAAGSMGLLGSEIADILVDTAEIGAAGAGLTAVPWNAAWDAEVQSEVADALDVAIPGAPTANSINQRIAAIDDLTQAAGGGDLAAILTDTATIGAPAGASVSADIAAVKVDTAAILVDTGTTLDGRIPAALVAGRMDSSVGAMAADVVTAAAVAAGAIDAATFAAGAIDAAAIAAGAIDAATFAAGAIDAAAVATGAIDADALATDAVNEIVDQVWDEAQADHVTVGSMGEIATEIASILADTGTDGVVVTAATANKVADHVLRRTFENASGSADGDTRSFRSLLGAIAKLVNRVEIVGSKLTVYLEDDVTSLGQQTVTTDGGADLVTKLDTD